MTAGRPQEHDRKRIFKELIEWSTNPASFNLIQFSRPRMFSVKKLSFWATEEPEFRNALDLAKESIAMNRFEAAIEGALPFSEVHRNEADYDPQREHFVQREKRFDLELEKEKMDHAHKLKKQETEETSKQASEIISQAIKAQNLINNVG